MATSAEREALAKADLIDRVRMSLRDYPELNTLTDFEEHSDELIAHAIYLTLEGWNGTPPLIGRMLLHQLPDMSLFISGVICELLRSVVYLYARNDIDYTSGTVSVRMPQVGLYTEIATRLQSTYERARFDLKVALNMSRAVEATGGVRSDYSLVHSHPAMSLFQSS